MIHIPPPKKKKKQKKLKETEYLVEQAILV